MATRIDRAAGPLVGGQPDPAVAEDEHRVERGEPEHPADGRLRGDDQEPVISARAKPGHGAHGEPAQPVGDQPFARGGRVEVPADLRAEPDRRHVHVPLAPVTPRAVPGP